VPRASDGGAQGAPGDAVNAAPAEAVAVGTAVAVELVRLAVKLLGGDKDRVRAILDAEDAVIEAEADARERNKFGGTAGP
jgi:hypothetical protein